MFGCLNIFSRAFGGMFLGGWGDVLLINGHLKGSVRDFGFLFLPYVREKIESKTVLFCIFIFLNVLAHLNK